MKMHPVIAGALSITTLLILGCKARPAETVKGVKTVNGKKIYSVTLNMTKIEPIGYEICGDHPLVLGRAIITATLRLAKEYDFPPGEKHPFMQVKGIVFRPGEHEVELWRNPPSERLLLYATAPLYLDDGLPTIKVTLDTYKLPKGQYELGISGDPFFIYCSVELQ